MGGFIHKPHHENKEVSFVAKEIKNVVKLQVPGGKATPAPPIGPILGQAGVNIQQFCVQFNDMTRDKVGYTIPVVLTVYADRSFSFITKTPPASDLLKKACKIEKGAGNSKTETVATITWDQLREIATMKMPDLNAASVESAMRMIAGTARSMGIVVED